MCPSVESFLIQKWERLRDEYYKGFANGTLSRTPHASDLAFLKPSRASKARCFATEDEDEEEAEFVITLAQIEAADEDREEDNAMIEERLILGQLDGEDEVKPSNIERSASSDDSVKTEAVEVLKREKIDEKGTNRAETAAPDASNADNRTEDQIFGDFVAATLAKLPLDEKKKMKREIMNILL